MRQRGFALVGVLVVVAILALGIALMMSSSKSAFRLSSLLRRKTSSMYLAETAVNLAKSEIYRRAVQEDCLSEIGWPLPLKYDPEHPDENPPKEIPRKQIGTDEYKVQYWYEFVNPGGTTKACNIGDMSGGPKQVKAVARVEGRASGEILEMEVLLVVQRLSAAALAFGILNPKPRASFPFRAADYDGHVHFGLFTNPSGQVIKPMFLAGDHHFKGPVTFKQDAPEPFYRPNPLNTAVFFDQNFRTNYKLEFEPDTDVLEQIVPTVEYLGTDPVCLLFRHEKYFVCTCGDGDSDVNYSGCPATGTTIPQQGLVYRAPNATVGVKGFYRGGVTVAARNIALMGDFVASDQADANYTAGLVAAENVIIPAGVPTQNLPPFTADRRQMGWKSAWDQNDDWLTAYADDESGVLALRTNFVTTNTPSGLQSLPGEGGVPDRDSGNSEYTTAATAVSPVYTKGSLNLASVLDIEAAVLSVGGILDVENLNNPAGLNNVVVPDTAGNLHSPVCGDLYTCDGQGKPIDYNNLKPRFCFPSSIITTSPEPWFSPDCRFGTEQPRHRTEILWITGGLLTDDYSFTGVTWSTTTSSSTVGIERRNITFNEELLKNPPPSFPSFANLELMEIYRKLR